MQLCALDDNGKLVFAAHAHKQQDYSCPECSGRVRLRGGFHRQDHFFHLEKTSHCRQNGKGMVHLQVQHYLLMHLPEGQSQLEHHFTGINRIADVAWTPHKIVFEIQCSPISAEEVLNRNTDYGGLGWQVVWILHDTRFNKWRLSAAEEALSRSPHFFTNINSEGEGLIYDQYAYVYKGVRKHRMESLPIEITNYRTIPAGQWQPLEVGVVMRRIKFWQMSFKGDLVDLMLRGEKKDYLKVIQEIELKEASEKKSSGGFNPLKDLLYKMLIRPYKLLFQMILEKACR